MASKQKDFQAEVAKQQRKRKPVKLMSGLIAGTIAGLAATWVLDRYKEGAVAVTRRAEDAAGADATFSRQQSEQIRSHHPVHKEAAQFLAQFTVGKRLNSEQQKKVGLCLHYAVGALAGGLYGVTAEWLPVVRSGYGTGFSSILFLGGSEALLPWLDQGKTQRRMPPALKVSGLSSHLVYGGVLETVRRVVRFMM
jgi:putative membrane protein